MTFLSDTKHANGEMQHTVKQQDANITAFMKPSDQPACNISSYQGCQALIQQRAPQALLSMLQQPLWFMHNCLQCC